MFGTSLQNTLRPLSLLSLTLLEFLFCRRLAALLSHLWMDYPARGDSVSEEEEGLVWRGRTTQAVFGKGHISIVQLAVDGRRT